MDSNSNSSPKKEIEIRKLILTLCSDLVYAVILSLDNSNSRLVFGDNLEHIEIDLQRPLLLLEPFSLLRPLPKLLDLSPECNPRKKF